MLRAHRFPPLPACGELAFSWLAAKPFVSSAIADATRPEQLEANIKAVDWALTADEIGEVDRITKR